MSRRPPLPTSPNPRTSNEDDVSTSSSLILEDPLHQKSTFGSPFHKLDQGTVGAVAVQEGDDLSYDISSQGSLGFEDGEECTVVSSKDGGYLNLKEAAESPHISFDDECREFLKAKGASQQDVNVAEAYLNMPSEDAEEQEVHEEPEGLLEENPTLEDVAKWIQGGKCKKIIVLSGAGVSCSAGIPDFRTPGTGL